MQCLNRELLGLLNFFESSLIPLQPGLYLSYLRLHSSLNSIHVLVPENLTSALPFARAPFPSLPFPSPTAFPSPTKKFAQIRT
jgi:hypothetical protein